MYAWVNQAQGHGFLGAPSAGRTQGTAASLLASRLVANKEVTGGDYDASVHKALSTRSKGEDVEAPVTQC